MQCCENEVARQRSFDRDFCCFLVARFTDEDDVRILPQEGSEDAREVESDIFMRLDLAQTRQIVFNRVFSGRNVDTGIVNLRQR